MKNYKRLLRFARNDRERLGGYNQIGIVIIKYGIVISECGSIKR